MILNRDPWAKSIPLSVLLKKKEEEVLLEHGHVRLFTHRLWQLSRRSGRVEQMQQKPYGPQSSKYLLEKFASLQHRAA